MDIKRKFIEEAVTELGFKEFTEVQHKVIPIARTKKDIIGCSQTGSGKTHAFLIPVFENLDLQDKNVQVVIVSPTRELATQIYKFAKQIAEFAEETIDIRLYVGGKDREKEMARLRKSQPQIIIGTPGKIVDLGIKENLLEVYKTKTFIIDEADMALDAGFLDDIDLIAGKMGEDLQMLVFSATIPEKLKPFLRKYMNQPTEIYIKPKELSSLNIEHVFVPLKSKDRYSALKDILSTMQPYVALIFCNTKEMVEEIGTKLHQDKFNVAKLHGDITPRERNRLMKEMNLGTYQYIIASDIASRGIDIDGVSHVINYELPKDMEFYVHRTGRTGRAKYEGVAVSIYTNNDEGYLDFLEGKGINIAYKDVKSGELVERRERKGRVKRENTKAGFDKNSVNIKRNNSAVKPGYKKKYHKDLQQARKKALRNKGRQK